MAPDKNSSGGTIIQEARMKGAAFCAYQERTQQQVRDKLYALKLDSDTVEETIAFLIAENYINEERFAKAYAGGKFRIKHWGRVKIKLGLKQLGLSDYCIEKGMQEIQEEDYQCVMEKLVAKRVQQLQEKDAYKRKHKTAVYLIGKGYESDMVWDYIRNSGL